MYVLTPENLAFEQLLQSFDSNLRRRGRAASTRRQYSYSLRSFVDRLGIRAGGDLTAADLELFLTHWEAEFQTRHGHLPRPATMRGTIGALRVFFAYLEQAEFLVGSDGAPRRNPASTRTIPLLPQLVPLLHEHLAHIRPHTLRMPDTPFLVTKRGTPVTTNYMWRVVKRVANQAGVRPVACSCGTTRQDRHASGCPRTSSGENRSAVSPHTLRRTFGSDLINRASASRP